MKQINYFSYGYREKKKQKFNILNYNKIKIDEIL